jgi:hypothetical protein
MFKAMHQMRIMNEYAMTEEEFIAEFGKSYL